MLSLGVTSVMSMGDPAYEALEQSESGAIGRAPDAALLLVARGDRRRARLLRLHACDGQRAVAGPRARADRRAAARHRSRPTCGSATSGRRRRSPPATDSACPRSRTTPGRRCRSARTRAHTRHPTARLPAVLNDKRMLKLLNPWQYSALQNQVNTVLTPAEESSIRQFTDNHVRILRAGGTILDGTDEPLGLNDWGLQPTLAGFVRFEYPLRSAADGDGTAAEGDGPGRGRRNCGNRQAGRPVHRARKPAAGHPHAANVEMMKNGRVHRRRTDRTVRARRHERRRRPRPPSRCPDRRR